MHSLVKVKALEPCDPGWEQSEGAELRSLLASPLVTPACQLGWQQSLAHSQGGGGYAFSFVFLAPTETSSD